MALPIANVLHAEQLRNLADGKTFARGQQYHREGRVSALRRDGKTMTATVSGAEDYVVKLWSKGDRIAYSCTCPIGSDGAFCKHCVAVSLALAEQLAPRDGEPADAEEPAEAEEPDEPSELDATIVRAPAALPESVDRSVFLAGSIDSGQAARWRDELIAAIADLRGLVVLDPRRVEGAPNWKPGVEDPRFREQVEWELDALERAGVIAMYFAPDAQAPDALLQLGLYASSGKLIVCCSEGYGQKGYVEMVCRHHGVHQTHDLAALGRAVRARVGRIG